ncbi:MAG: Cna B-type domain-containing protein, partial [Oscillospiraceae bacterium]|nr:Cna B-type domain-containing protein [Oscillospiraceae bacterium]
MKNKHYAKRFLSLLLCLVMVAGMIPASSFAAEVGATDEKTLQFHKMQSLSEIQIGAHYVIVYNTGDTRYALGAGDADDSGDSAGRSVTVIPNGDNLEAEADADYVFTMTNRRVSDSYGYVQFEADNGLRLKLGTNSNNLNPLLNTAGGQITLYQNTSSGLWTLNNSGRYLSYSSNNGFYVSRSSNYFEIWTDAVPNDDKGDARYVEYAPINQAPVNLYVGSEMLIVYTAPDGKSYALITPDIAGNNAVPVTLGNNVSDSNGVTTTAITTNRANAWTLVDNWSFRADRSSSDKSVFRATLSQGNQYLWMSGDNMFATDSSKQAYLDIEWKTPDDFTSATYLIHGSEDNRYLGWDNSDPQNPKFIGNCTRENAVSVRIYGPPISQVYSTYYRLTDLSKLNEVTKFVISVPDPATGKEDSYLISATSSLSAGWIKSFSIFDPDGDGVVIVDSSKYSSVEFEHGGVSVVNSKATQFESAYIRANNLSWYPKNLMKFDEKTGAQYAPFDSSNKKVRFEYGDAKENGQRDIYLRGNGSSDWLAIDKENNRFTTVSSIASATPIKIYAISDDKPLIVKYRNMDGQIMSTVKTQKYFTLAHMSEEFRESDDEVKGVTNDKGETLYTFVGWTKNETLKGYLSLNDSVNIYDYDSTNEKSYQLKKEIIEKYELLGDCNPDYLSNIDLTDYLVGDQEELNLYPVYAVRGFDSVVTASEDGKDILGVSDWKELQTETGYKDLTRERWLGSVNVEIYKDGVLWKESSPMYFSYHNDNTVDVNLKFIWDDLVEKIAAEDFYGEDDDKFKYLSREPLYQYMTDYKVEDLEDISKLTFPAYDQLGHFVLDGVIAKQGGSQENLWYKLNWMTDHGGRLDNVEGGSTIKVYVSTKYNVKYYLDGELIEEDDWTDPGYYTTPGTDEKFKADSAIVENVVDKNNNKDLLNIYKEDGSPYSSDETFWENVHHEAQVFSYRFYEYPHKFSVAKSPAELVEEGYSLISTSWSMQDEENEEYFKVLWPQDGTAPVWYIIEGDQYGSENTIYAYKEGDVSPYEADAPYTYHLYAVSKPEVGDLTVSKVVDGRGADKEMEFEFTVTLGDTSITGKYGEMEFNEGVADFTLHHGQSVTAKDLPAGMTYSVFEKAVNGYTTDSKNSSGTIKKDESITVEFVNTRDNGALSVTKMVDGRDGEKERDFAFTVTLSDTSITGQYGDMYFNEGVANFTLRHGQTKTARELPTGITYKVKEETVEGYTVTSTGTTGEITKNDTKLSVFVNNRNQGDLTVSKTVLAKNVDPDEEFSFIVTLSDTSINGKYGNMEFVNGIANFTLTHGQSITAEDLPAGITYKVEEETAEGYKTVSTGETGKIEDNNPKLAAFSNIKLIDITVTKAWDGDNEDTRPAEISVQLYQDGAAYGEAVELNESNSWTYTWDDLEESHEWTVKEVSVPDGYRVSYMNSGNDWTVTNTKITDITVQKVWSGDKAENRPEEIIVQLYQDGNVFGSSVKLNEANAWKYEWTGLDAAHVWTVEELIVPDGYRVSYESKENAWTITNTKITDVTVTKVWEGDKEANRPAEISVQLYKDGAAFGEEVKLNSANNWTYTWKDLDEDHVWTVEEISVPDGYRVSYIDADNNWTITNVKITDISVEKVWEGDKAENRPAEISVQLYMDGEAYGEEVKLNAENEWTYTWTGLDEDHVWTVDEVEVPAGYRKTASNDGFAWTITNVKITDVTVTKVWEGDKAENRPAEISVQ